MSQDPAKAESAKESGTGAGDGATGSGGDGNTKNETAFSYSDMTFDDFDAQSEALRIYDQEYIKTSTDRFQGRFASAFLDHGVSVHHETMNSAMNCRVSCLDGLIGFGVSLGQSQVVANGVEVGRNDVIITRPGSELNLDVPPEGAEFLVLAVDLPALESLVCTDAGLEYLRPDSREVSLLRAEYMANAVEAGGMAMLQAAARAPAQWRPHGAAGALAAGTVAALDLDAGLGGVRERTHAKKSAAVLAAARDALSVMEEFDYATLAAATGKSPRLIQMAFAEHLRTTPTRYFRAVRLHRARNALLAGGGARPATISNVAAAHGFWNWSRFAQLYRRQFGETPSETRARAAARGESG